MDEGGGIRARAHAARRAIWLHQRVGGGNLPCNSRSSVATAHERIGKAVQMCVERTASCRISGSRISRSLSPAFGEDFYESLSLASVLAIHDVPGGTAPNRVRHAIAIAKKKIESLREEVHAHA